MNADEPGASRPPVNVGLPDIQFDRVEPAQPAAAVCAACGASIEDSYYTVNGLVLCRSCSRSLPADEPAKADYARAALYGAGAALAGTALYFAILAVTGYEIGLIAVAVGWMVGKAVHKGSRGTGGRKFQLLAVALTYLSIVGSYVPLTIKYALDQAQQPRQSSGADSRPQSPPAASVQEPARPQSGLLVSLFMLVLICLASPFLNGLSSIIGLFIIFIGLYEAWKLNQRIPYHLEGPFAAAPSDVRS